MRDWEPFDKTNDNEDPWNFRQSDAADRRSLRRPEQHDADPDHAIGSCDEGVPHHQSTPAPRPPKPRRRTNAAPLIVIIVIAAVVVGMISSISSLLSEPEEPDSGWSFSWGEEDDRDDRSDRDDHFNYDVDPDGEDDLPSADELYDDSTEASNIEPYPPLGDFTLELVSNAGKEALTYQEIYARVLPSVVTITVYNDHSGAYATGIILSEDGYILTNQHVTGGEDFAEVQTWDNVRYPAQLVGEDPNSDLAVLKIDATSLTPAEFGDSEELTVGDESFAIGNPMGIEYRGTFTNGIISALNRSVGMNGYTMTLIQTTAALNSGNSGGPLINIYGQVIGVNNMKIMSSAETVEGLGFAIPSTTAQRIVNTIIADGVVEHPMIGITCYGVSEHDPEGYGATGILVVTVMPGSDAEAQGILPGDIITAVNGIPVYQVTDVTGMLPDFHVGDQMTATIYREDEGWIEITFALSEQNDLQ